MGWNKAFHLNYYRKFTWIRLCMWLSLIGATYVHELSSQEPRILSQTLLFSFIYNWTSISLSISSIASTLVIYFSSTIILWHCWHQVHLYQVGCHQGQHISLKATNIPLWTLWKPLWCLDTTCKCMKTHLQIPILISKHQLFSPILHQGKNTNLGWMKYFPCRSQYYKYDLLIWDLKFSYWPCSPWAYFGLK